MNKEIPDLFLSGRLHGDPSICPVDFPGILIASTRSDALFDAISYGSYVELEIW